MTEKELPVAETGYSKKYLTEIKKIAASIPRKDEALLVICVKYYRFKRQFPALKGRATLFIPDLKMLINEVSYFEKDGKRWIRLPTYHSGHIGSDTGKPVYKSYFKWTCSDLCSHFYQQAIDAIALKIEADALLQIGKMMQDPLYEPPILQKADNEN